MHRPIKFIYALLIITLVGAGAIVLINKSFKPLQKIDDGKKEFSTSQAIDAPYNNLIEIDYYKIENGEKIITHRNLVNDNGGDTEREIIPIKISYFDTEQNVKNIPEVKAWLAKVATKNHHVATVELEGIIDKQYNFTIYEEAPDKSGVLDVVDFFGYYLVDMDTGMIVRQH